MLSCPNRCDAGKVAREDMSTHLSQLCPAAVIPCQFREIGCKHVVSLLKTFLSMFSADSVSQVVNLKAINKKYFNTVILQ